MEHCFGTSQHNRDQVDRCLLGNVGVQCSLTFIRTFYTVRHLQMFHVTININKCRGFGQTNKSGLMFPDDMTFM